MQLPIGEEDAFTGVIDLLANTAWAFTGDKGETVEEISIPEEMRATAEEARAELIEKIVEHDDVLTEKYLGGEEVSQWMSCGLVQDRRQ